MRADLRERLRVCVAAMFYYSGLVRLALWRKRRDGRYLIILNYHRAAGGHLREHMRRLRRHYRLVDLGSAVAELYAADAREQRAFTTDKRPPLVLTFDDGYLDNYTHGLRYAQELRVPFTVFPVPSYVDSGRCFWWLAPHYLLSRTRADKVVLDGREYHLRRAEDRAAFLHDLNESLFDAPSVEAREALLARAERALEAALPQRDGDGDDELDLPATWSELLEMQRSGLVSFGGHTVNHPVLAQLADEEELVREVSESRRALEERLGEPISAFAYPIGKLEDIGERAVRAVRESGYECAVSTIEGINTPETDQYLLRRLPGDIRLHWLVLEAELAGLLGVVSRIRRKLRRRF